MAAVKFKRAADAAAAQTRAPIWPKINAGFVREMLAGHSILGLALAAPIYLICLTGSLVVFIADLRAWEQPRAPVVRSLTPEALDRVIAHGVAAGGKAPTVYVMTPRMSAGHLTVATYAGQSHRTDWADTEGRAFGRFETPFADFADALHMYLTLPEALGLIVVGIAGAALLALIISGVLAHPRVFRDAFTLRWGGSKRLQEADLHNRLSVWGLPFHLAVTLTGAFFGLSNLMILALAAAAYHGDITKAYAPLLGPAVSPAEAKAPPPARIPSMASLLSQIGVTDVARQVDYIGVENAGAQGMRLSIETAAPDRLPRGERWFFDAQGRLLGNGGYADGSIGAQAYAAAASLHFGSFGEGRVGAPAVRIAYGLLGLALTTITAGGISIWLARRRDAGRPAPRTEALWLGVVWAVPLALAVAALGAFAGMPPTPVFWALSLALCAAAPFAPKTPTAGAFVSRWGKLTAGVAIAAVAAAHLIARGLPASLGAATIDAALLLGGGLLVVLGLRTRA